MRTGSNTSKDGESYENGRESELHYVNKDRGGFMCSVPTGELREYENFAVVGHSASFRSSFYTIHPAV